MKYSQARWPELEYDRLKGTTTALHMWMQIVGKFKLANTIWLNHSWHATLYINSRGFTTALIQGVEKGYEVLFDFVDHKLRLQTTAGESFEFALESMPVADFHTRFRDLLKQAGAPTEFHGAPNEVPDPVPFARQTEAGEYDPDQARRFWTALTSIHGVFETFRSGFLGKVSPVHFFWGSADLALTRFSGREAPRHPGGVPALPDPVTVEAYSHEVSSAGFWAGANLGYPAFYSYAYPTPAAFVEQPARPEAAFYDKNLGEFLLPYEAVRSDADPESALLDFLQSTYAAAAETGDWDRAALECEFGRVGVPRKV